MIDRMKDTIRIIKCRKGAISCLFLFLPGLIIASLVPITSYPGFLRRMMNPKQNGDFFLHLVVYAGLSVLMMFVFAHERRQVTLGSVIVAVSVLLLGAMLELSQPWFSATRQSSWGDMGANAIGVSIGIAGSILYRRFRT